MESKEMNEGMAQDQAGVCLTVLAGLPDMAMLDDQALAHALGVCQRTVRRMAARYELPPGFRQAGKTVWLAGKVRAWITERAEQAERKAHQNINRLHISP